MKEKTALLTGATNGIGRELAIRLLDNDFTVFGIGRDQDRLDTFTSMYPKFRAIQADLRKNEDINRIVKTIEASGLRLDLNIQNAGMKSPPRPLEKYDCESIDEVFQVNLLAPMKLSALLIPFMKEESRILFVTSRAATLKLKESSTYCASKAGLDEITAILRQELEEKNIGVANVIPGEVDTHIQEILRDTPSFFLRHLFIEAKQKGQLISPKTCSEYLKWLLCDMPFDKFKSSEMPQTIYDKSHHQFWLTNAKDLPDFPF